MIAEYFNLAEEVSYLVSKCFISKPYNDLLWNNDDQQDKINNKVTANTNWLYLGYFIGLDMARLSKIELGSNSCFGILSTLENSSFIIEIIIIIVRLQNFNRQNLIGK